MTPYTPIEVSASTYSRPASTFAITNVRPKRHHRPGRERRHQRRASARAGTARLFDVRRDDDFLDQQLEHVGERLQQSPNGPTRFGPMRTCIQPMTLRSHEREVRHGEDQRDQHDDDLDQHDDQELRATPGTTLPDRHAMCEQRVEHRYTATPRCARSRVRCNGARAAHERVDRVHRHVERARIQRVRAAASGRGEAAAIALRAELGAYRRARARARRRLPRSAVVEARQARAGCRARAAPSSPGALRRAGCGAARSSASAPRGSRTCPRSRRTSPIGSSTSRDVERARLERTA